MVYLKTHSGFETYKMLTSTEYAVTLEDYAGSTSRFEVANGAAQEDVGSWLVWDGHLFLLSGVKPTQDRDAATLTCREPMAVFDRDVYYTAGAYGSLTTGAFIEKVIHDEFITQPDSLYALPQMSVSNLVVIPHVAPCEDGQIFNFYEYLCGLRDSFGIFLEMNFSGNSIQLSIVQRHADTHNVVIGDGHSIVDSLEFGGGDTVSKVTAIVGGTKHDYYLQPDGSISTTPPTPRIQGKWEMITQTSIDVQAVQEQFGQATGAHKLEFRCDRDFMLGDVVNVRTAAELVSGRISCKAISSHEKWISYTTGDLAVTLTDKLQRSKT